MRDRPPDQGLFPQLLYEQCVGSLMSHRIYMCKGCEIRPMDVYCRYLKRLESADVLTNAQLFFLGYFSLTTLSEVPAGV